MAAKPPANSLSDTRLAREWSTMQAMILIYCRSKHRPAATLCPECQGLQDYAKLRLERCRFGPEKPTCASCPVHCYQKSRREEIRAVMRHAGPRMLWRHPILSLRHWLDGFRKTKCAGESTAS
jgi:Nitrous oxide-stimulated promoter